MDYIKQINVFWKLDAEHSFNGNESRLYFYLLNLSNSLYWKNPVTNADGYTAEVVGISVNTLKSVRNRLQQAGLITFKPGGHGSRNKCVYYIVPADDVLQNNFNKVSNFDTLLKKPLTPYAIPGLQKTDDISKHKPNKTENREGANEDLPPPSTDAFGRKEKAKTARKVAPPPPSLDEVKAFMLDWCKTFWTVEEINRVAEECFFHYDANGWVQNKGKPIVKWQAACQKWVNREKSGDFKNGSGTPAPSIPGTKTDEMLRLEVEGFYRAFLTSGYKAVTPEPCHYELLKKMDLAKLPKETVAAIREQAKQQRIRQIEGSNIRSELDLLEAYRKGEPVEELERDKERLNWLCRRLAMIQLFANRKAQNKQTFFES